MKSILTLLAFVIIVSLTSCSHYKEKVVQSMDNTDRPSWASLAKTHFKKDGKIYFVGFTENKGNARISSVIKISDNLARHEIAKVVANNMNYIYQNAEEGIDTGGEFTRFYGSEVSGYLAQDIYTEERYWEKVVVPKDENEKELRVRAYSLVSVKQTDLKKALREVMNKDKSLSPQLRQQIDLHMKKMVENLGA